MPISNPLNKPQGKKIAFNICGKSATLSSEADQEENQFFTIAPALPILPGAPLPSKLTKRSHSSLISTGGGFKDGFKDGFEDGEVGGCDVVALQQSGEGRNVVASRTQSEREKNPDRICLDRRGLTTFPEIVGEKKLRLMSLQHNLISKIDANNFSQLTKLVFLDLYDNQIEKIIDLNTLENLRVLLIGKNRIKKIDGLKPLIKLEVLDLHGNQIVQICGLEHLSSLKVLNLAGNNVKVIGQNDFQGLISLRELNLKRNKIKKLLGFGETPQLQKLYLSNNDIQKIEDMGSLAKAFQIREITIDGNPVTLNSDCVSFLVSYLPNLQVLSTMQVNEQVRRVAMAWRTSKEQSNSAFLDLSTQVCVNVRREEVITNAKTNWELLRSKSKCFTSNNSTSSVMKTTNNNSNSNVKMNSIQNEKVIGLHLENHSHKLSSNGINNNNSSVANYNDNPDGKLKKNLEEYKAKEFGSLTSINGGDGKVNSKSFELNKKRSNSSDGLIKADHNQHQYNKINAMDFKLPPILLPIINNLTNSKLNDSSSADTPTITTPAAATSTTDSELDSSESHESLKSGLRNHLLKINSRGDNDSQIINHLTGIIDQQLNVFNRKHKKNFKVFPSQDHHADQADQLNNNSNCQSVNVNQKTSNNNVETNTLIVRIDDPDDSEDDSRMKIAKMKKIVHYKSNRAATARAKHRAVSTPVNPPTHSNPQPKEKEQGGDYLVEIAGRCLNVYGQNALRFIDRSWDSVKANDVNTVKFNYVQFNGITTILNKLKSRFPNIENYIFKETNISYLGQINALAEVQGLVSIHIEPDGNPIISKDWKVYAVFRLSHWGLKYINGKEISEKDEEEANEVYSGLIDIVMWSLPESLLQPLLQRLHLDKVQRQNGEQITAKQFLFRSDPALRNVVAKEALQWRRSTITQEDLLLRHKGKLHLSNLIDQTICAIEKLQLLDKIWPNIFNDIIKNTLKDYSQMNLYMKRQSKLLNTQTYRK